MRTSLPRSLRRIPALLGLALLTSLPAIADEGMWQPHQLPELADTLKAEGLEIPPSSLTDLLGHPMNAIISLGNCTASFVSPEGLVITNHHCIYRSLQYNSTPEKNLISDGFLAETRAEEISAGPGSRVFVTVAVDEVTDRVRQGLDGLEGRERFEAVEDRRKKIVAECEEDAGHRCRVASFHGGLQYFLTKQLEIRDVRLVYAPKGAVGFYGGEVDNWEWPRHTGDYAFLRAYVAPDGKPAENADENVPYRPAHHLTVSSGGVSDGDYVMVTGYPGRTSRYRTASEVKHQFGESYPYRIASLRRSLDLIAEATEGHPEDAIKYAGRVQGLSNGLKNNEGMMVGYGDGEMVERKRALEAELRAWVKADPERQARYGEAIEGLDAAVADWNTAQLANRAYQFASGGSSLSQAAKSLVRLVHERQKPDAERDAFYQERNMPRMRAFLERLDRSFSARVDKVLWMAQLREYVESGDGERVEAFDLALGLGESFDAESLSTRLDAMYDATVLDELEKRMALFDATPEDLAKHDDPFVRLAMATYDHDLGLEEKSKARSGYLDALRPAYMEALLAYRKSQGEAVYADANSTLRVTFGQVTSYSPRDAVRYAPFTTPRGLLEKETGEEPFASPPELLAALEGGDFGRYACDDLGTLPVNFLADLDITGGNSGSPTLDDKAELVGLVFDGNWESIISDWDFRPEITRSIHVDARYMLWIMDHVDGADHLLREMGLEAHPDTETAAAAAP
ncbi:MAG: S46 family peptidase [Holophagales bacterium]|nr:S46 family peptidase [Holophagales bacterium]